MFVKTFWPTSSEMSKNLVIMHREPQQFLWRGSAERVTWQVELTLKLAIVQVPA